MKSLLELSTAHNLREKRLAVFQSIENRSDSARVPRNTIFHLVVEVNKENSNLTSNEEHLPNRMEIDTVNISQK